MKHNGKNMWTEKLLRMDYFHFVDIIDHVGNLGDMVVDKGGKYE